MRGQYLRGVFGVAVEPVLDRYQPFLVLEHHRVTVDGVPPPLDLLRLVVEEAEVLLAPDVAGNGPAWMHYYTWRTTPCRGTWILLSSIV